MTPLVDGKFLVQVSLLVLGCCVEGEKKTRVGQGLRFVNKVEVQPGWLCPGICSNFLEACFLVQDHRAAWLLRGGLHDVSATCWPKHLHPVMDARVVPAIGS